MPARQLQLLVPPRPLVERLGNEFFRAVPRSPGVYIMTGSGDRVLYIGQSKNLRARLGSYKNARPDRAPRKVIRLIHLVQTITWEKCPSAQAALLRENELLRLHRPRFNRLNTYPAAYPFVWFKHDGRALELGRGPRPEPGAERFGVFNTGVRAGFAAILRWLWAATHRPESLDAFSVRLLSANPPRRYRLRGCSRDWLQPLRDFLEGRSDELITALERAWPSAETQRPFESALRLNDMETLRQFFKMGPLRNHRLRLEQGLPGRTLTAEQLDDSLAWSRSA